VEFRGASIISSLLLYFQTYNFNTLAINLTGGGNGGIKILVHVLSIKIKEWLKNAISEMSFYRQKGKTRTRKEHPSHLRMRREKLRIFWDGPSSPFKPSLPS
jgi:hypothetical protein